MDCQLICGALPLDDPFFLADDTAPQFITPHPPVDTFEGEVPSVPISSPDALNTPIPSEVGAETSSFSNLSSLCP